MLVAILVVVLANSACMVYLIRRKSPTISTSTTTSDYSVAYSRPIAPVARAVTTVSHALASNDPLDARPDPTARFNVFRLDDSGRLVLSDQHRYSGNDPDRAEQAVQSYRDSDGWSGAVYAYDGRTLRYGANR